LTYEYQLTIQEISLLEQKAAFLFKKAKLSDRETPTRQFVEPAYEID